jgi:hypothetical protein
MATKETVVPRAPASAATEFPDSSAVRAWSTTGPPRGSERPGHSETAPAPLPDP